MTKLTQMPRAWADVLNERTRQVTGEGRTTDHDDSYRWGELARAAACYAAAAGADDDVRPRIEDKTSCPTDLWPWSMSWWKPTSRRRDLVIAGALILAEIERLDRATPPKETPNDRT